MNDKILELLNYATGVKEFTAEQAPLYVAELLEFAMYDAEIGIYMCAFFMAFGIGVIMVGSLLLSFDRDEFIATLLISVGSLVLLVSGVGTCFNYMKIKKIEMAPRVFVIENLKGLSK